MQTPLKSMQISARHIDFKCQIGYHTSDYAIPLVYLWPTVIIFLYTHAEGAYNIPESI